ncbi:MAG: hypothetical protein IPH82_02760 [Chloroflexi bacterium]|nr:hypothetical protein [Chloroflexota bacterium]
MGDGFTKAADFIERAAAIRDVRLIGDVKIISQGGRRRNSFNTESPPTPESKIPMGFWAAAFFSIVVD